MMTQRHTLWLLSALAALAFLLAGYFYVDRENLKNEVAFNSEEAAQRQSELKKYHALKESLNRLLRKYHVASNESVDDERLIEAIAYALSGFRSDTDSLKKSLSEQMATAEAFTLQAAHLQEVLLAKNAESGFIWHQVDAMQSEIDSLQQTLEKTTQMLREIRLDSLTFVSPRGLMVSYYGRVWGQKPAGFGIGFYKSKGYYIGEWDGNARHGKGKHVYLNGDVYEGEFVNDLRDGYGIYRYASGELYEGEWKADLMNGAGKITFKDGDVKSGIWLEGKIIENN